MTPAQRRVQLLDVGQKIFDDGEFEELSMDEIAARSGVTRALLYHYFTSKADYFAAIWQRAHETLGAVPAPAPNDSLRDWVADQLVAYLDFYRAHPHLVIIANRSSVAAKPVVRDVVSVHFRAMAAALFDAAGCHGHERLLATAAFEGWIAFMRETTVATLVEQTITAAENLELALAVLDATVGVHARLDDVPLAVS